MGKHFSEEMCSLICIVFKNIAMVPLTKQFTGINSCNFSPVWHCGIALTHIHEQSSKAGSLDDIIPSLSSVACLRHKEREGASEGRGGAGLRQRLTFVPVKTMLLRHPTAALTLSLSLSVSFLKPKPAYPPGPMQATMPICQSVDL